MSFAVAKCTQRNDKIHEIATVLQAISLLMQNVHSGMTTHIDDS